MVSGLIIATRGYPRSVSLKAQSRWLMFLSLLINRLCVNTLESPCDRRVFRAQFVYLEFFCRLQLSNKRFFRVREGIWRSSSFKSKDFRSTFLIWPNLQETWENQLEITTSSSIRKKRKRRLRLMRSSQTLSWWF